MAQEVIFERQTIREFAFNEAFQAFVYIMDVFPFTMMVGESYIVEWEGETHPCIVQDASAVMPGTLAIGNLSLNPAWGGTGNNEPFIIGASSEGWGIFITLDPEPQTEYEVAIYKEVADEPEPETAGATIILKDRSGIDVVYDGIKTVTFDTTTEGEQVTFTLGVEQTGLEVELNLKDGDQTVKADSGKLLKALTIKKPESLQPKNIRKGENVCGVEGELIGDTEEITVGESEGAIPIDFTKDYQEILPSSEDKVISKVIIEKPKNLKPENIAEDVIIGGLIGTHKSNAELFSDSGTFMFTADNETLTISHKMAAVPDKIVYGLKTASASGSGIAWVDGCSAEVADLIGVSRIQEIHFSNGSNMAITAGINRENSLCVSNANPLTFQVVNNSSAHLLNTEYKWYALAGLAHHAVLCLQLALDGGNLVVTGGVPEIEQILLYNNGALAKTVEYVHSKEFIIDVSDMGVFTSSCTFTVEAVGANLNERYPERYYGSVSNGVIAGGTCGDNARWVLYDDGALEISGEGAMDDYTVETDQPWNSYGSSILSVRIKPGITHLGSYTFRDCTGIASVSLPDTLATLGGNCLRNTALTSLVIPYGVTTIPVSMVYNCAVLTSVTIPDSVTSINDYAFYGCSALAGVVIPDGVTRINYCSFYNCTSLASVNIPESVTIISDYAFGTCSSLTSVELPTNLTELGNYAFYNCTALKSITLPAKLIKIGEYAFYGSKLTSITIPAVTERIGRYAFSSTSLTSAVFKDTTTWYRTSTAGATSGGTSISSSYLSSSGTAADYLKTTYNKYYWYKL